MEFTIQFIKIFFLGIYYASPLLVAFVVSIVVLGQIIGRSESWSRIDALYYSFITATTVGYGDFRPAKTLGKFLAIFIALLGLLMTGIIIALGVKAGSMAFQEIYNIPIPVE